MLKLGKLGFGTRGLLCALLGLICAAPSAAEPSLRQLAAGAQRFAVEVAQTSAERASGLMHRQSLPNGQGMLFVFEQSASHCMWMKNTLIALTVAFLDEQGRILNLQDMVPLSEQAHCAAAPARYALEMNRGWFARHGIGVGDKVRGLESAQR